MSMCDGFLKYEVDQLLHLQQTFQSSERVLGLVSKVFSPTNAEFVVGPLLTTFTGESPVEMMVAMTLSDYASIIMKWVAHENRPFWWVRETPLYTNNERPRLRQHPLTCETSAGGPSSHATIITVILFYQGRWLVNYMEKRTSFDRDLINCFVFAGVSIMVLLTWISRTYIGASFPHQCVSGTILALCVISILEHDEVRKKLYRSDKKRAVVFVVGLLMMVGLVYFGLITMGMDPMWSVRMAFNWCEDIHYPSPETTPVYRTIKNLGSASGIALCAPLEKRMSRSVKPWKQFTIAVCFVVIDSAILAKTPKDKGIYIFLLATFMTSLFHAYAMIELVPKITNWLENIISRSRASGLIHRPRAEVRKLPGTATEPATIADDIKTTESN